MVATTQPVRVGLVGAGHWASTFHAPMLAGGPETTLVGVWARRADAAAKLAREHAVLVYDSYAQLLEHCDAVAFAVPPDVQARLAIEAAEAGKGMLLEKPLALDVAVGREVADAIARNGVGTVTCLTFRFNPAVDNWLQAVREQAWHGARAVFACPASIAPPFASPWRRHHGPLYDLGPHIIDLLEAALGPVTNVLARGRRMGTVVVAAEHATGASSSMVFSAAASGLQLSVDLYGEESISTCELVGAPWPQVVFGRLRSDLANAVRGGGHQFDAAHNLHLLEVVAQADAQLDGVET